MLLRRWADADGLLISHRVDNGFVRPAGPAALGRLDGFVQPDLSDPIERRWAEIESIAGEAIVKACAAREPPIGAIADALKDLLALHLLRSRDSSERWANSITFNERIREFLKWLNDPGVLEQLVFARIGIHAAGPEILAAEKDQQLAKLERELGMGGLGFVESTLNNLERARERFAAYSIQIGWSDAEAPFLISDTPAIPLDTDNNISGFRNGVTLNSATQILMPIGPHHTLSLGPEPAWVQVPHDIVRELNELQLWNSRATVMYGTQSGLGPWVDEWRHRHVHPDDLDRHGTNPNRR